MSKENVETLRRLVEATAAGDYQRAVAELDPDIEIDDTDITEASCLPDLNEHMPSTKSSQNVR